MNSHEPRTIVITGVSQGLGRVMVETFVRLGHIVVGCARNAAAISLLKKQHPDAHLSVVNVARNDQIRDWALEIHSEVGTADLLINNAAIINKNSVLWKVEAEEFDQLIDVNIKGVANVLRHFLPPMVARSAGVVVNFSSGWGRSTSPEVAPYCASKFAIEGLTRALSQELPKGMAAVALNPGIINTDMLRSCLAEQSKNYPSPKKWAEKAVPYLLHLGSEHNGQSLDLPD